MKNFLINLYKRFKFGKDQLPQEEVVANIESAIEFKGAKLWLLILAIFVASLGLNVNSTAVIIGAMLISPLMGPILGMGLGAGVHDFSLMKKSFKSYLIATIFSVVTAFLYFLISPFNEVQSELLARTSPSIYDVLIALCGGFAGIVGISCHSQRQGNVIPGVAIATALMPPLCTVGFGLATANYLYALGALYLYVINTVFIAIATSVGVEFIFKFKKNTELDNNKEKKFQYIMLAIVGFVILPSLFVTFSMVKQSIFENNAHKFCKEISKYPNAHLINNEIDYRNKSIKLIFMGEEIDSISINNFKNHLSAYDLQNIDLQIIQANSGIDEKTVKNMLENSKEHLLISSQKNANYEKKIEDLQNQLEKYNRVESLSQKILNEAITLFPEVKSITLAYGTNSIFTDSIANQKTTIAIYQLKNKISANDKKRLQEWLEKRIAYPNLMIIEQ